MKHEDLMRIWSEKQQKAARKKGKISSDTFELGDTVRIQNMATSRWDKSGVIKEVRTADDGQEVSFVISLPNGRETIRHCSHLRHNINRYTRITETKVRFDLKVDKEGEDRKKSETKKSVQPLKLHKSKSADSSDSWEIASNQNKDDENGIATHTRSKVATNMTEIPIKSALKKRTLEN